MKIKEFWVVTQTSIYHVEALGEYRASAKKIAVRDKSSIEVGHDIAEGGMIAICKGLQGFIPEKYGSGHPSTGFERRIEMVNTQWWRGKTSPIVGLFKTEAEARRCFQEINLTAYNQRWLESTRNVIDEIGEDHPSFYISHFQDLELLPKETVA